MSNIAESGIDIPYPVCLCGTPYDSTGTCPNCYVEDPTETTVEETTLESAPDREETFREDVVHGESVWGF